MKKILLVEDNEENREMLRRRLQRRGYEVIEAVDGEQAIAKANSENPAIVLMDMSLPVIDGWEATRRLRAGEATKKLPIIGLTAHAMVEDKQKVLDAGCSDYATKPIKFDALIEMIERWITQQV